MNTKHLEEDYLVSVIALVQDEAPILGEFCAELYSVLEQSYANYEVIIVDDCSRDATKQTVQFLLQQYHCMRYLRLARPFGREIAVTAGFETAIGDFIVVLLPSFDPVALIPQMIERAQTTGAMVIGRSCQPLHSPLPQALYRIYHRVCSYFFGIRLIEDSTYFMVLTRSALNSVNRIKDKYRYVKALSHQLSAEVEVFDYQLQPRGSARWGRGLFASINLGIDIIVSNSLRPLRYVSLLGLVVSGIYLAYFGYIALIALFKPNVAEGWITLSTQNALAFFVLNIILATVCEYIGLILVETKDRPFYFLAEEQNSSVMIARQDLRRNVVNSSEGTGRTLKVGNF